MTHDELFRLIVGFVIGGLLGILVGATLGMLVTLLDLLLGDLLNQYPTLDQSLDLYTLIFKTTLTSNWAVAGFAAGGIVGSLYRPK